MRITTGNEPLKKFKGKLIRKIGKNHEMPRSRYPVLETRGYF
jgi:hypothetical protein